MNLYTWSTSQLRDLLRHLIVTQLATLPIAIVCDFFFPPPEEIRVAVALMAEEGTNQPTSFAGGAVTLLILASAIFVLRALWQLYRFEQRGLPNYLWGLVTLTCLVFLSPAGLGSWSSPQATALNIVSGLATGGMLAICLLKPEIFVATKPSSPTDTAAATSSTASSTPNT